VWNAPIFYPHTNTLAFSENLFGIAILVAPIYWLTKNAVLTYNVAFISSFTIAGVGMYLLVRALTGSRHAAWIGAVFYAFGPFRLAQMAHIQMVATGWLPITLFALHRYLESRRRAWLALFIAAYALQATSNSYVAYFLMVPVGVVIAAYLGRVRDAWGSTFGDLAIAALTLGAILSPVVYHYDRARIDLGQQRGEHEIETFSADLRAYVVGKTSIGIWRWLPTAVPTDPEKELFPGVVPVLLAAVAIVAACRRRDDTTLQIVASYGAIAAIAMILSLGPVVHTWGSVVTQHGPYGWLYRIVPGWGGMRVPARFAIIVVAALAVLASVGARVLLSPIGPSARTIATVAIAAAIFAEGWSVPIWLVAYSGRGRVQDRAVADWLRGKPDGAVLHLPVHTDDYPQLHHQFVTLEPGHPLVSAYSGWESPLLRLFKEPGSPLYDFDHYPAVVRMLRAAGIRYVVVDDEDFTAGQREAKEPENSLHGLRASGQVSGEQTLFGSLVFELRPWTDSPPAGGTPIDTRAFTVTVAQAEDRAAKLVDGDRDTRWFGDQDGNIWIAAQFPSAHDIARVELTMATRSLMDYPRELRIESTDAAGTTRTLYEASPYPEFLTGFLRNPDYPVIAIALPRNETRTLRIRETAVARRWWSVYELALFGRDGRNLAGGPSDGSR
jgi:hypothetical protein